MAQQSISIIASDFQTQLSGAISPSATSFTIQSVLDADGNTLSDGTYCFTIDRDNAGAKEYLVGQLTTATKTVSSISSVSAQGVLTANAQKAHRIGANVIISDHSILSALSKIFRGQGTIDPTAPLAYTSNPTLSSAGQLATKGYVDSVVTGGTVNADRIILASQTAGETVAAGNVVYLKASDSRWWLADADVSTTYDGVQMGIALGSGTAGNAISGGVQIAGTCGSFTGLTANNLYYLSSTAGGVSTSAGTPEISIGVATSTTSISLAFKEFAIPTGQQKDAMAGGGAIGTPSSSNKFITENYWTTNFVMDSGLIGYDRATESVDNSAVETTVYTKSVTNGFLGTTDGLRFDIAGIARTNTTTDNPYFSVYFGSTEIGRFTFPNATQAGDGNVQEVPFTGYLYVINNASASSQNVFGAIIGGTAGVWGARAAAGAVPSFGHIRLNTTASFNTAQDFDITVRMKNENASSGETVTFDWCVISKLGAL